MAKTEESYTQRLSREIDAAYEAYKADEPDSEERLLEAFRVQARNVIVYRLQSDDPTLEYQISHRAILALKKFRGESKLSTWFYHMAQNETKRELRRRIRDRERHVPIDVRDDEDEDEKCEVQLAAKTGNQDASLDLQKLRKGLSKEQKEVFGLMEVGYTLEEVAKQLGLPLGTIRSRYRLAKAKMKRLVQKKRAAE
jgi:RNA polymerase sigma-70 factor, ECF subfamily